MGADPHKRAGELAMRCHICDAPAPQEGGACRACGARLRPTAPGVPGVISRPPLPTLAPVPVDDATRLLGQIRREADGARIVAGGFVGGLGGGAGWVLVLDNGMSQHWDGAGGLGAPFPARHRLAKVVPVSCAAFSTDLGVAATGHETGQVRSHRLGAPKGEVVTLPAHRGRVLSLSFSGARGWSAGNDGAVVSLILPASGSVGRAHIVLDGLAWLHCMAISPDGTRLALGGDGGEVELWRTSPEGMAKGRDWALAASAARMKSLAFSPDGKTLLGRDARGTVRLWAAHTGHELQRFTSDAPDHSHAAPALAPDNRTLALPGANGQLRLLDAWTGAERAPLLLPFEQVQALAWAPPATLLVAGIEAAMLWRIRLG